MRFRFIYRKLFLFIFLLAGTFIINATAYISEIINNTDQFLNLVYTVPTNIKVNGNPNSLPYDTFLGTQINVGKKSKVSLRGAYLPEARYDNIHTFKNAIRLYVGHKLKLYANLCETPFISIRKRNDWAEASRIFQLPGKLSEMEKNLRRISFEPITDDVSYILELNQLSDEVYVRRGGSIYIPDDAIEVVLKRSNHNEASPVK